MPEILESIEVPSITKDSTTNLITQTLRDKKQVLVFNKSKSSSEATAERAAQAIIKVENQDELNILSNKILKSLSVPTKQCRRLATCVKKGVAFHHSGLVAKQRTLIEKAFRTGILRVISSTPTLAAGLNLPAYKVIIKDYKRYSQRGFTDIPVLEFHQMSGRAGRPGKETVGKAVVLVKDENELSRVAYKYVFGKPEEILSKLAVEPTLKMYVLSLISMEMINTKDEIEEFFSNTLYGYQYKDLQGLYLNILRILKILKDYDFVSESDGFYKATPLGKKVSELYLNPDTAHFFLENLDEVLTRFSKKGINKSDVYALIHFVSSTLEMRPLFRIQKKEEDYYMKRAEEVEDTLLVEYNPFEIDIQEFANSLKTADIYQDWVYEAHEEYLSERYGITPGELNYKKEVIDWLLYSLEEFALLRKNYFFRTFVNKLRLRFKFGVKDELLSLIVLKGVGRVRARQLFNAGFKRVSDLQIASFESISRVVGESLAIKIKTQIRDDNNLDKELIDTPREISVRREINQIQEVFDDEVNTLVENYEQFEKEKEEGQKSLDQFF